MADTANLGPEARFRAYLDQGKFMIQRSKSSGRYVLCPRGAADGNGETGTESDAASGHGTVYSTTVVRNRPEKGGDYNVALIDLEEGPRMMSRVVDIEPSAIEIGMKVRAKVGELDGKPQVLFTPA